MRYLIKKWLGIEELEIHVKAQEEALEVVFEEISRDMDKLSEIKEDKWYMEVLWKQQKS